MKKETLNIKGKSGKNYLFHIYSLSTKLMSIGGVFFYLKRLGAGDYKAVKIGLTHNFEEEMKNFVAMQKAGITHIAALPKNGKANQEQMVADLRYIVKGK